MNASVQSPGGFYGGTIHQTDSRKPECYIGKSTWAVILVSAWCMAALHYYSVSTKKKLKKSSGPLSWFLLCADVGSAAQLLCVIRSVVPKFVVCTLEYTNEGRVVFVRAYFTGFLVIMTVPIVYFFLLKLGLGWSELSKEKWTLRSAYTFLIVLLQIGLYFFMNCVYVYSVFKLVVYVPKHENRYHWLTHKRLWSRDASIALVATCVALQLVPCLFKLRSANRDVIDRDVIPRHTMTTWQLLGLNTTYYAVVVNLFYDERLVKSGYVVYDAANILTSLSVLLTFGLGNFPNMVTFGCSTLNCKRRRKHHINETLV